MVVGHINGQIKGNIMVTGKVIKCMVRVNSLGILGEAIREIIMRIKNMVLEFLSGQMDQYTRDNGNKGSSMEKVYL